VNFSPYRLALSVLLLALAACAGSGIGRPCALDNPTRLSIAFESSHADCMGDQLCLQAALNEEAYCTDNCITDRDCRTGFSCVEIDLRPSGAGMQQSLCIADNPTIVGDDDDDDATPPPEGVPPVISNLQFATIEEGGQCYVVVSFHWHDEDGDLNAARNTVRFDGNPFSGVLETLDAVDSDLSIRLLVDNTSLLFFGQTYDIELEMFDLAGNASNMLQDTWTIPETCGG